MRPHHELATRAALVRRLVQEAVDAKHHTGADPLPADSAAQLAGMLGALEWALNTSADRADDLTPWLRHCEILIRAAQVGPIDF